MSAALTPTPRAILLDLDDTVVPWQTTAHWQWSWHPQGPVLSERHARAAIKRSMHAWDRRRWDGLIGTRPPTDLAEHRQNLKETLLAVAGRVLPPAEVEAVIDRFLHPAGAFETYPEAAATIDALVARGDRVGICTELPESVGRNALRRAGIRDGLLLAYGDEKEGPMLPAAAAFKRVCARLGTKPADTLYVGDLFWSDVRASSRAGLTGVLIDRADAWPRVAGRKLRSLRELLDPPAAPSPPQDGSATPNP